MKERPILFSGEMVKAILEVRKTQMRRVVKPVRGFEHHDIIKIGMPHSAYPWAIWRHNAQTERVGVMQHCPYGQPGDRLWVREAANLAFIDGNKIGIHYRVEPEREFIFNRGGSSPYKFIKWTPSIFMPRWASRITLEITKVRVERIQDISRNDIRNEGAYPCCVYCMGRGDQECDLSDSCSDDYSYVWRGIWDSINAKRGFGWDANPWVWVVEFMPLDIGARSEGAK